MITAAKAARKEKSRGQSILEFMLLLPVMLGLGVLVLRVSTVVQAGIVNQQYVRAQALLMAHNSPYYPRLETRNALITENKENQIIIGISENAAVGDFNPLVPKIQISDKPGEEDVKTADVATRSKVRVRSTVTMCIPPSVVDVSGSAQPVLPMNAAGKVTSKWNLTSNTAFNYCVSRRGY